MVRYSEPISSLIFLSRGSGKLLDSLLTLNYNILKSNKISMQELVTLAILLIFILYNGLVFGKLVKNGGKNVVQFSL